MVTHYKRQAFSVIKLVAIDSRMTYGSIELCRVVRRTEGEYITQSDYLKGELVGATFRETENLAIAELSGMLNFAIQNPCYDGA
jgi:hypothetical protein